MSTTAPAESPADHAGAGQARAAMRRIAILGNPNTGKTTLFNCLSGLRARTANFPGITVEARVGHATLDQHTSAELIDLPGIYSVDLDLIESRTVRDVLDGAVAQRGETPRQPDVVVVVIEATNVSRNLMLAGEVLRRRLPTVIAVNMIDVARRKGLEIDAERLAEAAGCAVVKVCARTGEGVDELRRALLTIVPPTSVPDDDLTTLGQWADDVYSRSGASPDSIIPDRFTDRLDQAFTHPILGLGVFGLIMGSLFYTIFYLAQVPMGLVDSAMTWLGGAVEAILPSGILSDLVVNGIIAGIAGVVIFLPQIILLFFLLTLLEDTGYLARAAFVMDRLFRRFGLPGQAFVPLLSSHACAIPGIMSARLIPDRRDRLATILVAPFMTCPARLPVYILCIALLFGDRPGLAALVFFGAYILGAVAALISAAVARGTVLKGRSRPMALELPTYKWPSLKTALFASVDRAVVFLKQAGTIILAICIIMWGLSRYPGTDPLPEAEQMRVQATELTQAGDTTAADTLIARADALDSTNALENSFAGRIGHLAEPVFAPIGYDWRLSVGVMTSFAAREAFVSTMAVIVGTGDEADVSDDLLDRMKSMKRTDGSLLFTGPTAASLLVFYILALQCLPTLAVTRRETGAWKWALLQFAWMSGLAYGAAFITYQGMTLLGVG
ncbi:MAG: ferrous iron transporter B [Phycisphaerales bacterium]|nr:ferrous iron transporter B [Phycisphaerales bacterium]